jgi:1-acyl-sn-glycerol-3-phosphate acyltransferase
MTRGSSINVRIFADERGGVAQCLDLPIDLLGTAGAELAVKLAASLVRIRFVPVHGFSPTYCVQQHFRRGPGLRFNAESASNNSASLAPRGSTHSMRSLFHSSANQVAAISMKLLFGCVASVHVVRRENANRDGGFLLATNHISHFDPFIISSVVRRKIDWMAMAEFFPYPVLGHFLRAVDAFPVDRNRADRTTIRGAIERLKNRRIVGLFPEGGIRDGARSLLEGAPLRPGASTLAHIAGVPILPCVILGSDRLYSKKRWLPLRRTSIWIAFGNPIPHFSDLEKSTARACIERELAAAFKLLYAELQEKFSLTPDDLPHPPRERMVE